MIYEGMTVLQIADLALMKASLSVMTMSSGIIHPQTHQVTPGLWLMREVLVDERGFG